MAKSKNPSTGVKLPKFKYSRQGKESLKSGKYRRQTRGKFRNIK